MKSTDHTAKTRLSPDAAVALAQVALSFAGAWAAWLAAAALGRVASSVADAIADVLLPLGTMVPAFAAYALFGRLARLDQPVSGRGGEARGFFGWHFSPKNGLAAYVALLAFAAWHWLAFWVTGGFPDPLDALAGFLPSLAFLLVGGGLEELGWRGGAQLPLTAALARRGVPARLAPIAACVAVGLAWGVWHAPLLLVEGSFQSQVGLLPIIGAGVAMSLSLGAMRALSASTLPCILAHAWYNSLLVAVPAVGWQLAAFFAVEAVAGAAVLAGLYGPSVTL